MARAGTNDGGKSGGGGLIGLIVVTLLALGCGAGFGFFLDAQLKSAAVAKAVDKPEAPPPEAPKSALPPSAKLVELTPIVANLAEPKGVWMRIEASLLVDGEAQGVDALTVQFAEDMLAYLKTTTLAQFQGPSGFQNLREDFKDRAAIRDAERIKDVIIHGVVVE